MTFLNASLLAGFLAAAIPIAVHLMSRRQPRRVVFPATRFLKHQLESSRTRLRVQRWWLLALRVLAVLAFAAALARPQIETSMSTRWFAIGLLAILGAALLAMSAVALARGKSAGLRNTLAGAGLLALLTAGIATGVSAASGPEVTVTDDSPVALAIVLDNSVRSSRRSPLDSRGASGTQSQAGSVIEVIRDHALWMIGRYPSDSRFAVIDRSPRPAAFALDVATANRQIQRTEPLALTRPLAERIEAAVRLVRTSELSRRMVMVITDLTQQSFPEDAWQEGQIGALLAQDPPIRLQILDVGSPAAANRKIGPLSLSDATPPRLTPVAVSTLISVEGQEPSDAGSVTVELQLYDTTSDEAIGLPVIRDSQTILPPLRTVDRTTVRLSSAATNVLLSVPPLELGTHHGIVRIVGEDELAIDDSRYFTLQVRPTVSALIVAENRDSAAVIGLALTVPLAIDDPLAEYRIEISEWLPSRREAYRDYELIVLVDPVMPSPAVLADLDAYLTGGGKLIWLLGPSISTAESSPTAAPPAFPAGLVQVWRIPAPGTFLEVTRPNHPAMEALAEIAGGVPWNAFRISQYWQLQPGADDVVIMRYAGPNHPALIHRPGGLVPSGASSDGAAAAAARSAGPARDPSAGSQLILTTPLPALTGPAGGWNELFSGGDAWPAWLLLREMVQSLVDQDKGTHNLLISDLPSIPIGAAAAGSDETTRSGNSEGEAGTGQDAISSVGRSDDPQAVPVQMFPPRGPAVPLRASGDFVTIGNVDLPGTYWLRGAERSTGFSINLLPGQTDLARADPEQFAQWLGPDNFDLVRDRQEVRQAEGRGEPTRPLYGWILLIMAGALVLEQILANRFYAPSRRPLRASVSHPGPRRVTEPWPGGGLEAKASQAGNSLRGGVQPEQAPLA